LGVGKTYAFPVIFQERVRAETGREPSYEMLTEILEAGRPDGEEKIDRELLKKNLQNFRKLNASLVEKLRAYYRK
jgi:hypothetical protein